MIFLFTFLFPMGCGKVLKLKNVEYFQNEIPKDAKHLNPWFWSEKGHSITEGRHPELSFSDDFLKSKKYGWRIFLNRKRKPYLISETEGGVLVSCLDPNPYFTFSLPFKIIGIDKVSGKITGQIDHIEAFEIHQKGNVFFFVSKKTPEKVLKLEIP